MQYLLLFSELRKYLRKIYALKILDISYEFSPLPHPCPYRRLTFQQPSFHLPATRSKEYVTSRIEMSSPSISSHLNKSRFILKYLPKIGRGR